MVEINAFFNLRTAKDLRLGLVAGALPQLKRSKGIFFAAYTRWPGIFPAASPKKWGWIFLFHVIWRCCMKLFELQGKQTREVIE